MPRITPIHYKKFEKFLFYIGCEFKRQKGDHLIYQRSDLKRPIVVPAEKSLPVFIILGLLRTLKINREEYLDSLKKL
ncbi:type II toxin-antitoxin system HicA family toxin [bacterium]|nr:type II toxin-antitoxin system HicA family toxin [bacterium]MBU3954911.1 type II toxin-antitoxin system HicA family toxin [bacterium]